MPEWKFCKKELYPSNRETNFFKHSCLWVICLLQAFGSKRGFDPGPMEAVSSSLAVDPGCLHRLALHRAAPRYFALHFVPSLVPGYSSRLQHISFLHLQPIMGTKRCLSRFDAVLHQTRGTETEKTSLIRRLNESGYTSTSARYAGSHMPAQFDTIALIV